MNNINKSNGNNTLPLTQSNDNVASQPNGKIQKIKSFQSPSPSTNGMTSSQDRYSVENDQSFKVSI